VRLFLLADTGIDFLSRDRRQVLPIFAREDLTEPANRLSSNRGLP